MQGFVVGRNKAFTGGRKEKQTSPRDTISNEGSSARIHSLAKATNTSVINKAD